jgi:hypothetical protein
MRMEWLRGDDDAPACWACFLVYAEKVAVLGRVSSGPTCASGAGDA